MRNLVSQYRCQENISPSSNFCGKCALPISITEQYVNEVNLIQENKVLQNRLNSVEGEISNLTQIIKMMQQNPILSQIKPEALSKRKFQ